MNRDFIIKVFIIYFLAINIVTFFLFALDKYKAIHDRWRIRESILLGFSLIGGAIGGRISMMIFHHKTRKKYFSLGLPLMIIIHLIICVCILYQFELIL